MTTNVDLRTVDLSAYPDLVVIYLGMRVRTFPGIKTLLGPANRQSGRTTMFSARQRLQMAGETPMQPEGNAENDLY